MEIVEEFMNIHIATNVGLTIILFLIVYGSYFIATYVLRVAAYSAPYPSVSITI